MEPVGEEVRSTINGALDKLIEELQQEKQVSADAKLKNEELRAELDQSKLLVKQLKQQIAELKNQKKEVNTVALVVSGTDDADKGDAAAAILDAGDAAKTTKGMDIYGDGKSVKKKEIVMKKQTIKEGDLWMNERRRKLVEVINIMRFTFRGYFGLGFANRWGFYVDRNMSKQIFDYYEWIDYPKGGRLVDERACVFAAVISSDGYYLFTGTKDGSITACLLTDLSKITKYGAHTKSISSLAYRPSMLASGGADNLVRIWNARNLKLIRKLEGHTDRVMSVTFNTKGDQLISGSADTTIRVWSPKSESCLSVLDGHNYAVYTVLFANNMIVSGSQDGLIKLSDPAQEIEERTISDDIRGNIYDLAINCDKSLLCCLCDGKSIIYSWPDMRFDDEIGFHAECCAFHPSLPHIIALANYMGTDIRMYNVRSGEMIHSFKGHTKSVHSIRFSPDGYRMISVSSDKSVRMWNLEFLLQQ